MSDNPEETKPPKKKKKLAQQLLKFQKLAPPTK